MERLTKRISENIIELSARANPIQYNGSAQRVHIKHPFWNVFNKLCDYEDAEEQHIELGNTLYIVLTQEKKVISKKVLKIDLGKKHDRIIFTDYSVYTIWGKNWKEYINKTVFKREEEAEQALARMEGENE